MEGHLVLYSVFFGVLIFVVEGDNLQQQDFYAIAKWACLYSVNPGNLIIIAAGYNLQ